MVFQVLTKFESIFEYLSSLLDFSMQGKPFSFQFPIEVKNIKLTKHTSDSGVYDKEGRYISLVSSNIYTKNS